MVVDTLFETKEQYTVLSPLDFFFGVCLRLRRVFFLFFYINVFGCCFCSTL